MTDAIEEILSSYFTNRPEVSAVFLFGSYAHGNPRPTSDVDVGVLLTSFDRIEAFQHRDRYLVELARLLRKDLHLVILNLANDVLLKQIFLQNRCLVINDPKKLSFFKMTAYARIAEFGYYHQIFKARFARNLMEG